jgi:polyphosphate kinase
VGRNAPVVETLLEAIENEKQVAALVELKARFDEESNIEWARALERDGVHVVYGLQGLKVHCKAALVVRQEGNLIRCYVHLSTGNYNSITSQLYTDIGMFTCDEEIGADCTDLFNYLTGYSAKAEYRKLLVAPTNLRERLERLIKREIEHQRQGERGHLIFKMNALVDKRMIRLLYEASQAGVQVDLLVRGICCLRPGIRGVSENIRVISIVGRFLEHSRIYYFRNAGNGNEEIYLGSADLMPRNLNRRVEVMFPVGDAKLIRHLRDDVLATYLADVAKARYMQPDGSYLRDANRTAEGAMNSQQRLIDRAVTASSQ